MAIPVLKLAPRLSPGSLQPRDGRLRNTIGSSQIGLCSAFRESLSGFLALVRGKFRRTAKTHPAGFGALPAVARASEDQFPFKLGETTQDREHQPAMRRCRVGPSVKERFEACAGLGDRVEDI